MTSHTQSQKAMRLARSRGVFSARDASDAGIHSQTLTRLVKDGTLERVGRGRYHLAEAPVTEHHSFALAAKAIPDGVICLLSALSFHGVGTQLPFEVWIAVDRRRRRPAMEWPPLRVLRFGGDSLTAGVEVHDIEGQRVRVFSLAKTIADLFKYRKKLGLAVALEALKESWRSGLVTIEELHRFAVICRVDRVMQPYLETVVA